MGCVKLKKKNHFLVYVRTKVYLCHNEIFLMPKGTKTLGNSKAQA